MTTKPSCTEKGEKTYTCRVQGCGATKTEEIKALGHNYGELIPEEHATCTENGVAAHYECSNCHKLFDSEKTEKTAEELVIGKLGHDIVGHEAQAPTCEEVGWDAYDTCSRCDYSTYEEKPVNGHNYGKLIPEEHATCTENGVAAHYECSNCHKLFDSEKTEKTAEELVIGKLGHTWADDFTVDVEATCYSVGSKSIHCKNCSEIKDVQEIEKTDHEWEDGYTVDKPATCTTDGVKSIHCKNCDAVKSETTIPAGHDFGEWETVKSPDCENKGSKQRICKVCTYTETEDIDANGHTWDNDFTIDREATCTTDGSKSVHCSCCNAVKDSTIIPALNHDLIHRDAKVATCTDIGWFEYDECLRCDYSTYKEIAPLGHIKEEKRNKATFTTDGSVDVVCSRCGYIFETTAIPKPVVILSKTAYTYNGKIQIPSVSVEGLVNGTDYTLSSWSSGRKNVGTYTATITLKGDDYDGSKTLSYKINPKKATIKTPAKSKTYVTVKWAKQSGKMSTKRITGYQVQIAKNKSFTSGLKSYKVKGYTKTSKKITKLKRKTQYYVRVRTYLGSYYSEWSSVKAVKTK